MKRRHFLKISSLGLGTSMFAKGLVAKPSAAAKVVVVGGGCGGATAARFLKAISPGLEVTLIEPNPIYHTCFMSNEVVAGHRRIQDIAFQYQGLAKAGVKIVHDWAQSIDADKRVIKTARGGEFPYDRAIVSPGIQFKWDVIEGYDSQAAIRMPHAWQAGDQTLLLANQLKYMDDGGVFVISVPPNPFRCPPGPYERASLIAEYFKQHKPRSKVLILDAKDNFTKKDLFIEGWQHLYGFGTDNSLIEWRPQKEDGTVTRVDTKAWQVYTELDEIKASVFNIVPPQQAGHFAVSTGLTDESGWCPVNAETLESTRLPNVHVLGDAANVAPMPKSGFSANSQAKVCASQVVALLADMPVKSMSYLNTCYSLVAKDYGISIAAAYRYSQQDGLHKVANSGGVSPANKGLAFRQQEARHAHSWYTNMTIEMFG